MFGLSANLLGSNFISFTWIFIFPYSSVLAIKCYPLPAKMLFISSHCIFYVVSVDLDRSLLELELVGRQALIVVPLERGTNHNRGGSLSQHQPSSTDDSSDGNNGGYFGIVRRILSYVNPLSYLGGAFRSSGLTWD